jgi:hypothetical protein
MLRGSAVASGALVLVLAILVTGCDGGTERGAGRPTRPATTSGTKPDSYVTRDPADFPKMASHLAFDFGDGSTNARFALNVIAGCNPSVGDKSHRINPKQVNFIVPGVNVPGSPACGSGWDFAVTYGDGYHHQDRPLVSKYRGIGTIRPFDSAPCHDIACYTDGTRMYSESNWVLNMASSGSDDSTAEWAARLRAHWYLHDLDGSPEKHPGIQGVWGDNFAWYRPYFERNRSPSGAAPGMTGRRWDDGAIRNQAKVAELLGPNVLVGANGIGSACGFGDVYEGSVPGADCTVGDATAWEGYGGAFYMYDPRNFDSAIGQFARWMDARPDGRAKYGFITEYGTCGSSNLGHPLTAQDERMGLALATIGGVGLWAVHDCSWSTTVVPGGQFSIPEMGENARYPRGWLGQPAGEPAKAASGRWSRRFTGGVVYANATDTSWAVDDLAVPPRDALFVKH